MSKPRYKWWPYVKAIIRDYPKMLERYNNLHSQSLCASLSGMPHGTEPSRATEVIAIRALPRCEQEEFEAVENAIAETRRYNASMERLAFIKMVYFDKTHTMAGAGMALSITESTYKRYNGAFVRLVAVYLKRLERSEYDNYYTACVRCMAKYTAPDCLSYERREG